MRLSISTGLLLCVGLGGCITAASEQQQYVAGYTTSELRELTSTEKALLTKGLAKTLKDPDSAKFEWTKIPKEELWPKSRNAFDYCATVNAKNSYGGYIGFQPFIGIVTTAGGKITGGYTTAIASADQTDSAFITDTCAKKGLDPAPRPS